VTIAGRFPDGADGGGGRGVKTVMTVSPRARVQRHRHDRAALAIGKIWRVSWPSWRVSGGSPVKFRGHRSHVTGPIGGGRHG